MFFSNSCCKLAICWSCAWEKLLSLEYHIFLCIIVSCGPSTPNNNNELNIFKSENGEYFQRSSPHAL